MTSLSLRTAFAAGLALAVVTACASGHARQTPPREKATVTGKELEDSGEPIEKTLQAKVPGLLVTRTSDGGIALQIRGASSLMGSDAPLYVIDEVPMQPGPGGALLGVNPHDIDTIKVLKDPADTGIYGMRGANGVILITTKKPGKKK